MSPYIPTPIQNGNGRRPSELTSLSLTGGVLRLRLLYYVPSVLEAPRSISFGLVWKLKLKAQGDPFGETVVAFFVLTDPADQWPITDVTWKMRDGEGLNLASVRDLTC